MTPPISLLDGELALPASELDGRTVADPDEDAVTLAALAALPLLERAGTRPRALVLATTSPPYDEGGNVQVLAELLGLAGDLVAVELTSSLRDGLTAVRLAAALAGGGEEPVLVCASHRASGEHDAGDGAAALLLAGDGGAATLRPGPARAEELRDRWRVAGERERSEADPSFVWDAGAARVARELAAEGFGGGAPGVVSPVAKPAARAERALGGPGDELAGRTGVLGAAHPLARILLSLDRPQALVAAAGGLAEAIEVEPGAGAGAVVARARTVLEARRGSEAPPQIDWDALSPYTSAPRSWRERASDLRLEGSRCGSCGRLLFPPPASCPHCGSRELALERLPRTGTVVTQTRDHAYPAAASTGMAVIELDGGGRFYGQVVPSARVEIGARVRLVPRRLHTGGGAIQYFWKIAPEVVR